MSPARVACARVTIGRRSRERGNVWPRAPPSDRSAAVPAARTPRARPRSSRDGRRPQLRVRATPTGPRSGPSSRHVPPISSRVSRKSEGNGGGHLQHSSLDERGCKRRYDAAVVAKLATVANLPGGAGKPAAIAVLYYALAGTPLSTAP